MFVLYHKVLYIVPEPLTKNRTLQTWRGEQVAMCEEREPLEDLIYSLPDRPEKYYIEEQPGRSSKA